MKNSLDEQIGGNHYRSMAIQPVEFIHRNHLGFIEGCIIKYICRYKSKNGFEDLEKIKHYVDLLIAFDYPVERISRLVQDYRLTDDNVNTLTDEEMGLNTGAKGAK